MLIFHVPEEDVYKKSQASVSVPAGQEIVGVVPSDFNHDGYLDVFIMARPTEKSLRESGIIYNHIFVGNGQTLSTFNLVMFIF